MALPAPPHRWTLGFLFILGLLLALGLFTWVPVRFLLWTGRLLDADRPLLLAFGPLFLAFCSALAGFRWLVLFVLSYREYWKQALRPPHPGPWPSISILVPACNEEANIDRALSSLFGLDYPDYEIVLVDDGSTDGTLARARAFSGGREDVRIQVHTKPNGGKWSALNKAFQCATGDLILCVDADSHLEPGALRLLAARLADPHVAGVSGQVRVRNRDRLLTRLQALEYLLCNGALRISQSHSQAVLVVPGPIGLYRRSALEEILLRYGRPHANRAPGWVAGPWEPDTFAEDFDLSLAILYTGGRIVYEPRAVAHTRAPDWLFTLLSQRYRWSRGSLQVLRKFLHRAWGDRTLRHLRVGLWVAATYLFYLTIQPFLMAAALLFLGAMMIHGVDLTPALILLGGFEVFTLISGWMYVLMHGEEMRLLRLVPAYDLYQTFVINCGWAIGIVDEIRGRGMRW